MEIKIDLVIPWVDGTDPVWAAQKAEYEKKIKGDSRENRYREWGMLPFFFRSIEKNMPWINKIHFITYGHLPEWLNVDHPKLHIVNHKDYIDSKYLPTFSSRPIELNIHRIEGLTEDFIYSNDDMYFINPLKPEDFFKNGLPCDSAVETFHCFRKGGNDRIVANDLEIINTYFKKTDTVKKYWKKWYSLRYGIFAFKNLYLKPAKYFIGFNTIHVPFAYKKSTYETVWAKEPELFDETCSHKFRSPMDVNQWLFRYWQLASGQFTPCSPKRGIAVAIGQDERIKSVLSGKKYKMLCLHDHDLKLDFETEQKKLLAMFEEKFPEKSTFERS